MDLRATKLAVSACSIRLTKITLNSQPVEYDELPHRTNTDNSRYIRSQLLTLSIPTIDIKVRS